MPRTILTLLVGFTFAAPRPAAAQPVVTDPFPLEVGNAWTYAGTVWWLPETGGGVLKERIDWRMEIVRAVDRGRLRGAVVRGHPRDLVFYGTYREPTDHLFVEDGDRLYLLDGSRAWTALARLEDPDDPLDGLVEDSDLVLELPLEPGRRLCRSAPQGYSDPPGCWVVVDRSPYRLAGLRDLDRPVDEARYLLTHRSRHDHTVVGFVPGLGFTSFAYGRSAPAIAVEIRLVKFELRPPGAPTPPTALATAEMRPPSRRGGEAPGVAASSSGGPPVPPADPIPVLETTPKATSLDPPSQPVTRLPAPRLPEARAVDLPAVEPPDPPRRLPAEPLELPAPPAWLSPAGCVRPIEPLEAGPRLAFQERTWRPLGAPEPIRQQNLEPVGEVLGVSVYTSRYGPQRRSDLWLPSCEADGVYQLFVPEAAAAP